MWGHRPQLSDRLSFCNTYIIIKNKRCTIWWQNNHNIFFFALQKTLKMCPRKSFCSLSKSFTQNYFSIYGKLFHRSNKMKKNGEFGMKKRDQRKKKYHVIMGKLWMYLENYYSFDLGAPTELCHKLKSIFLVKKKLQFV